MNSKHSAAADKASAHLLAAVNALCECGYADLPEHLKRACNWAAMARETIVKQDAGLATTCDYSHPPRVDVVVKSQNKWKKQDLRMEKARQRLSKKRRQGKVVPEY